MKKISLILSLSLIFCNCSALTEKSNEPKLTAYEKKFLKDDRNLAAEALVRKAILLEAQKEIQDEVEKYNLNILREEMETEIFIKKKMAQKYKINPSEIKTYYLKNYQKYIGRDYDDNLQNEIYSILLNEKKEEFLRGYINELYDKYDIDLIMSKEFPDLK